MAIKMVVHHGQGEIEGTTAHIFKKSDRILPSHHVEAASHVVAMEVPTEKRLNSAGGKIFG